MRKECCYTLSWLTTVYILTWGLKFCNVLFRICSTLGNKENVELLMGDEVFKKPWREGTAKRDDSALTSPSPAAGAFKELNVLASRNIPARRSRREGFSSREKVSTAQLWHGSSCTPSPSPHAGSAQSTGNRSSAGPPGSYQRSTQTDSWWLTSSHWSQTPCVKSFIFS